MDTIPYAKRLTQIDRLKANGTWIEPPYGFLADAGLTPGMWADAIIGGRAESLLDTWRAQQASISPEQRRERAQRARHDLYG